MNKILAIIALIAFLPACAALNCYTCATGMAGCNDPFNAAGTNVTTVSLSVNTYCMKVVTTSSYVTRSGSPACVSTPFVLGIGVACCQTDLCNSAQGAYQMPLLVAISFFMALFKFY